MSWVPDWSWGLPLLVLTVVAGALGAPMTAFLYDWNMLPIGQ